MITTSLQSLARWAAFAENCWYPIPDRPDLGCFGTGYNSWGVQTNQKYLAALAVLFCEEDSDTENKHEAFLERMIENGYTERQVRRLVEGDMRGQKAG